MRGKRNRKNRKEKPQREKIPIKKYAQTLRKEMTKEERRLWHDFLKILPVNINRQRVFDNYIVDFYIASANLVIELDGAQHYDDGHLEKDEVRDRYFAFSGIKVLRYLNREVENNFDSVCEDILNNLKTDNQKEVSIVLNEKKKILIVEDEKDISEILAYNIYRQGYEVETAYDGETGLKLALEGNFDLILLDVMLPKMDGFEICRRVRAHKETPIIILTAREEEHDKIMGLDLGADDYMTKPFSLPELSSRIKANIRRFSGELKKSGEVASGGSEIVIGDLIIDPENISVKKKGVEISLSKKEYDLLLFLAKNRGAKFPQDKLLEEVWGFGDYYDMRTVDVTVRRLRQKIEDDPSNPRYILNMRSVGYYIS